MSSEANYMQGIRSVPRSTVAQVGALGQSLFTATNQASPLLAKFAQKFAKKFVEPAMKLAEVGFSAMPVALGIAPPMKPQLVSIRKTPFKPMGPS
ncbi:MAG: hypothetical protein WCD70_10895 [Alphaproteobacteria bacterium]